MGARSPQTIGGTPCGLCIYVPNVDEVAARTVAAGATVERPVKDQFYGDRSGTFLDPFGHKWTVATHVEDVSAEEMGRRMAAFAQECGAA
jgi:PhnB protein